MKTIWMIGGWGQRSQVFAAVAKNLGGDVTCTSPYELLEEYEARGRGENAGFSAYAEILAERIPVGAVAVGWSMGGLVLLELATQVRGRFSGLVLVSSTSCFCARDDYAEGVRSSELRAMVKGLKRDKQGTLQAFYHLVYDGRLDNSEIELKIQRAESLKSELLLHGLEYLGEQDFRSNLARVDVPVLLIHGTADAVIPLGAADYLAEYLSASLLHRVQKGSHGLLEEQPSLVADLINGFISQ